MSVHGLEGAAVRWGKVGEREDVDSGYDSGLGKAFVLFAVQ